jgi:hypothetical protein
VVHDVISNATALAWAATGITGVTAAVAAGLWAGREHHTAPAPTPVGPAPAAYVPCHTTTCAHMTTEHDRTAAGLTCRGCGTTREEEL